LKNGGVASESNFEKPLSETSSHFEGQLSAAAFQKNFGGPFCCICLNGCSFGAVALDGSFWLHLGGAAFSSRYAKCLWGAILGSESQLWSKQTFWRRARRDPLKNEQHHFDCNFEEQPL
jgi:hypothetical protein